MASSKLAGDAQVRVSILDNTKPQISAIETELNKRLKFHKIKVGIGMADYKNMFLKDALLLKKQASNAFSGFTDRAKQEILDFNKFLQSQNIVIKPPRFDIGAWSSQMAQMRRMYKSATTVQPDRPFTLTAAERGPNFIFRGVDYGSDGPRVASYPLSPRDEPVSASMAMVPYNFHRVDRVRENYIRQKAAADAEASRLRSEEFNRNIYRRENWVNTAMDSPLGVDPSMAMVPYGYNFGDSGVPYSTMFRNAVRGQRLSTRKKDRDLMWRYYRRRINSGFNRGAGAISDSTRALAIGARRFDPAGISPYVAWPYLRGIFSSSAQPASDFSKFENTAIAFGGPGAEAQRQSIRNIAMNAGNYNTSPTQRAELLANLVKTTGSIESAKAQLDDFVKLLVVGGDEVNSSEVIRQVVATGNIFGLTSPERKMMISKIANAANVSTAKIGDIIHGMSYSALPASQLGYSQDQVIATITTLLEANLSAERAGTATREFFARMGHKKARKEIAKLGLNPDEISGDVYRIVDSISAKLKGMSPSEQSGIVREIFGQRGMYAFTALQSRPELYGKLYGDISATSQDYIDTASSAIIQGTYSELNKLNNMLEEMRITLGEKLVPLIISVTDKFGGALIDNIDKIVYSFGALAGVSIGSSVVSNVSQMVSNLAELNKKVGALKIVKGALLVSIGIGAFKLGNAISDWLGFSDPNSDRFLAPWFEKETRRTASRPIDTKSQRTLRGLGKPGSQATSDGLTMQEEGYSLELIRAQQAIDQMSQPFGYLKARMFDVTKKGYNEYDAEYKPALSEVPYENRFLLELINSYSNRKNIGTSVLATPSQKEYGLPLTKIAGGLYDMAIKSTSSVVASSLISNISTPIGAMVNSIFSDVISGKKMNTGLIGIKGYRQGLISTAGSYSTEGAYQSTMIESYQEAIQRNIEVIVQLLTTISNKKGIQYVD
jgi:TP901 family phage tail tape measure protein